MAIGFHDGTTGAAGTRRLVRRAWSFIPWVLFLSALLFCLWPVQCGRGSSTGGPVFADLLGGPRVPLALSHELDAACEQNAQLGMIMLATSVGVLLVVRWRLGRP